MIDILLPVFLLSLVLLGIHSYFGLEIIRRGIIFTDLAIGQMAAMGAAVSMLAFDGEYSYLTSLFFALLTGLLISYGSKRIKHLEAYIGLLYALGISAVFLLLAKSPRGMEDFHDLMAADVLFTPLHEILKTALFYSLLGLFIYFVLRRTSGFVREILFFSTFALTVTSSVKLAGVLTIFALLISPALIASTLGGRRPIITAWGIGTLINLAAIWLSFQLDYPTGYALVFLHALIAAAVSLVKKTRENNIH